MPRGIPWDDLLKDEKEDNNPAPKQEEVVEERDAQKDMKNIGKHFAFGLICGSLSGAAMGMVDVIRDPVAMAAGKKAVTTMKVLRYTTLFGGFFGTFHGLRKTIDLYNPYKSDDKMNDRLNSSATALFITNIPLVIVPSLRPMIPYGIFLVALDTINMFTEQK